MDWKRSSRHRAKNPHSVGRQANWPNYSHHQAPVEEARSLIGREHGIPLGLFTGIHRVNPSFNCPLVQSKDQGVFVRRHGRQSGRIGVMVICLI
jgi:hypothetical protein